MAEKMISVHYTESNTTGPTYRWNVSPLPPAPLKKEQVVEVKYGKREYAATMLDNWTDTGLTQPPKDRNNAKLVVYLTSTKERVRVSRGDIFPRPPACLKIYSKVSARWKRKEQEAIMTESWGIEVNFVLFFILSFWFGPPKFEFTRF
jgi:hypothetical protein